METNEVHKFGKFLVENLRDKGINFAEGLLANHWKAPELLNLQKEIQSFSNNQKEIVRQVVIKAIDNAIHDFLFAISEQADIDNEIQIVVDNQNIAELSDGLYGEAYGKDGWYEKFSKYKEEK